MNLASKSKSAAPIFILAGVIFAVAAYIDENNVAFHGIGIMFLLFGLADIRSQMKADAKIARSDD